MPAPDTRTEIVRSYFDYLTASDVASIVDLFADDGYVISPVLGQMPAKEFFETLDAASSQNALTLHRIMSSDDGRFHSAHVTYDWTLADGGQVEFDGVDVFAFEGERISSLKIFYDTHPTRAEVGDKYRRPDSLEAGRFSKGCAWIDGEYVSMSEAKLPLRDAGFNRSDATYDVVAVWGGKFFRLEEHLDRFEASMESLDFSLSLDRGQIVDVLHECVRKSKLQNAYVDMIATRGWSTDGSRDPWTFTNQFYAYAVPYIWIVRAEDQEAGSHLVIARETIRIPEVSVDPTVKNFHWADMTAGAFEAHRRGGTLAALADTHGNLTEGPGFNIFIVKDGQLFTPDTGVLHGITRQTVVELAAVAGITTNISPLPASEMPGAVEAFATSTAGGVMPITTIDGRQLGDGTPGPITTQLRRAYWGAHDDPRWTTPVDYGAP